MGGSTSPYYKAHASPHSGQTVDFTREHPEGAHDPRASLSAAIAVDVTLTITRPSQSHRAPKASHAPWLPGANTISPSWAWPARRSPAVSSSIVAATRRTSPPRRRPRPTLDLRRCPAASPRRRPGSPGPTRPATSTTCRGRAARSRASRPTAAPAQTLSGSVELDATLVARVVGREPGATLLAVGLEDVERAGTAAGCRPRDSAWRTTPARSATSTATISPTS